MNFDSILLSGCSFSDYCGWGEVGDHSDSRCWYNIFSTRYNLNINNISYGGRSNREIIHLAAQELFTNPTKYKTVIIQLTGTSRHWFFRETDPKEFCIINGANISNAKTPKEYEALKTIQLEFSPVEVETDKDLINLLMLQFYLKQNSINMILINAMYAGFDLISKPMGNLLDLTYSVGFDKPLIQQQVDFADDKVHPGEKSNSIYANLVGEQFQLLST